MNFNEVKELIQIINKSDLRIFELNMDNVAVKMSKNADSISAQVVTQQPSQAPVVQQLSVPVATTEAVADVAEEVKEETVADVSGEAVKAPIVGTFYESPSPDKPAFVKVGDSVKKGDVLCIIEAMKVMNEVVSDFDGVVKAVRAENEKLVEYGQVLFIIG